MSTQQETPLKLHYISREVEEREPRPEHLKDTRTLYVVIDGGGLCFVTPDGIGRYYYGSITEAREDYE